MYTIKVKDTDLSVSTSMEEGFKNYLLRQRTFLNDPVNVDTLDQRINDWVNLSWNGVKTTYSNLDENSQIMDIGSGLGIVDILAYQMVKGGKFHLLDSTGGYPGPHYYSEDYRFYNNWIVTENIIKSTNCNKDDFIFVDPVDVWTTEFDLITSYSAWCWHFPFQKYWDRVKAHLKVGGKLVVDISKFGMVHAPDSTVLSEITETFGSYPKIQRLSDLGNRYTWIRQT